MPSMDDYILSTAGLEQESANCGPQAKSGWLPVFKQTVLGTHLLVHSFFRGAREELSSPCRNPPSQPNIYYYAFYRKELSTPGLEDFLEPRLRSLESYGALVAKLKNDLPLSLAPHSVPSVLGSLPIQSPDRFMGHCPSQSREIET